MKLLAAYLVSLIERHPPLGYLGAAAPTATGFWVLVENITKIGAALSIAIGIAVGIVTWQVQTLQKRKLRREESEHQNRTAL